MPDPAVYVEFLLDDTWTDITTARWVSGSVDHTRDSDLVAYNAAALSLILRNENRDFDPTYTSSPYYPYLKPGMGVRVRVEHDAVEYPLFVGTLDSLNLAYDVSGNWSEVELLATDGFKDLARAQLPASVWEAAIRDAGDYRAWWRLSDPKGSDAHDLGPNRWHGTYVGSPSQQSSSLPTHEPDGSCGFDGVDDYVSLPNSAGFDGTEWTLELWLSCATFSGPNLKVAWSQGTSNTNRIYVGVRPSDGTNPGRVQCTVNGMADIVGSTNVHDQERVHVVLRRDGTDVELWVDGASEASGSTSGSTSQTNVNIGSYVDGSLLWLGYVDEVVMWDRALTDDEITFHYECGTTPLDDDSCVDRILTVGDWAGWSGGYFQLNGEGTTLQSTDLGGSALDYLNKVADSDNGCLFVNGEGDLTFVDRQHHMVNTDVAFTIGASGDIGYSALVPNYSDDTTIQAARISRLGGVVEEHVAAGVPNPQGVSREGLLHDSDGESLRHAEFLVNLYSEPQLRFTQVTLENPRNDPDSLWPVVLGVTLQDRVTLTHQPPGGGDPIVQESIVEGVVHGFGPKFWETQLVLSSARTVPFWLAGIVGHSEAGTTTRAGY